MKLIFILPFRLPVGYVITSLVHTTTGKATTADWALKRNPEYPAVSVECGHHDERDTVDHARNVIRTWLELECGLPFSIKKFKPPILLDSRENEPVRKGFRFVVPVNAFECVPYQHVIAEDEVVGPIKSPYPKGTFIVMPTKKPVLGEEAFYYAETIPPPEDDHLPN